MDDPTKGIFVLIGWFVVAAGTGAAFTFGVAIVCRWLKWSPINITLNVNNSIED